MTNRFLLEAGFGGGPWIRFGSKARPGPGEDRTLIQVTEQAGAIPGLVYRGQNVASNWIGTTSGRGAVTYVTGAHSLKFGVSSYYYENRTKSFTNQSIRYRFRNGLPNEVTLFADPFERITRARLDGAYAQEVWTRGELTLQGGLRYEHLKTWYPDLSIGPARFYPDAVVFPAADLASLHDIMPRMGASYDLFGNGKTALKVYLGRFMEPVGGGSVFGTAANPIVRTATSTTRSWQDLNRDYVPDCDFRNSAANGECGAQANETFGKPNVFNSNFDPTLLHGWGIRVTDWNFDASVQHQILPRVSASVSYFRRWFGNHLVTDNLAVGPSDYSPFRITAPADARLPGGGNFVINDLYDINPDKFGQVDNVTTRARNFGKQQERWHGVDFGVNVRLQAGLTVQGGLSTGSLTTDTCDVSPKIDNPSRRFCHIAEPFLTQARGLAAYTIPRLDVLVSGTFQTVPGAALAANYVVPSAVVAPSLGRNLAGGAANVIVNLVEPATLYGDRRNVLDLRVAKILRFGGKRTQFALDVFNALNSSAVETYNQTFGPRWLTPTLVLPARFAKIGVQFDF